MLTKEVLINSLRPYCGVIMEYDRRSGRLCIHWGDALTDGVRQRWLMPEQAMEMIRDGQCGVFNPVLVQCLTDIQDALRTEVYAGNGQPAS